MQPFIFTVALTSQEKSMKFNPSFLLLLVLGVAVVTVLSLVPEVAWGGTNVTFTTLETNTKNSVFGPLGKTVIYVASLGGALIAAVKGAWMFAGLGIAVAGLMYGASAVANSTTFGALIY